MLPAIRSLKGVAAAWCSPTLTQWKNDLSRFVKGAAGEEIGIVEGGRLLARPVSPASLRAPREFGFLVGRVRVGPDFDARLPDGLDGDFDGMDP